MGEKKDKSPRKAGQNENKGKPKKPGAKGKKGEPQGIVASIASLFKRKDPRKPIEGPGPKIKNVIVMHFRGILGILVPLAVLSWRPEKGKHDITVTCLWFWMAWFFLLQPVNIPVVGFIPLFLLPMAGVMSTEDTCKCYFDDNMALFVLAGMIHLQLNSCGADRRIIQWLLCSGDSCQFSGKRIIFKASAAAFFMSMISNKLIVTTTIVQLLTPIYSNLQTSTASYRATEPNYDLMRDIVLCSVQTASSIGSIAVLHASFSTLAMRAIWNRHPAEGEEYPDIFNYLQYTCFAFPVAFLMFILNFVYHMLLINWLVVKPMSGSSMTYVRNMLLEQNKPDKPFLTNYQMCCIFFYFAYLAACLFRWSDWLNMGWSGYKTVVPEIPLIKDATVAAIFVIVLHILPKTFLFLNYVTARVRSHIGDVLKPDSPVMWWRYVDKNTNYGYIILIGGAVALTVAIRVSKLDDKIPEYGTKITSLSWPLSVMVICLLSALLPNIMTSVAGVAAFLPFVLYMEKPSAASSLRQDAEGGGEAGGEGGGAAAPPPPTAWGKNMYLGALAVAIGGSMGFASPFLYTPAYFCHNTGKVPKKQMVKFAIGSLIICIAVLWLAVAYYAPIIWVDKDTGIKTYVLTTAAPAGGEGGGEAGGEAGGAPP